MNSAIIPCIWLDHQAEEAAAFYTSLIPNGRIVAVSHYPQSFENPGHKPRGSVLTVEFELGGQRFSALNGGPVFVPNPSISFFLHSADAEETKRLYSVLSDGGQVLMPLDTYGWSPCYGWVQDRFGISWQLITGQGWTGETRVVPCLMFANAVHGRAEEALQFYTRTIHDSSIESVERYSGERGPTGKVVHGRFKLANQPFAAMDSHESAGATFDEGLSLQIMCSTQAEVDHYWEQLSAGGSKGVCGWLKDRFGLSWQIVPSQMDRWMASGDSHAKDRTFQAMLSMTKLDIAELEAAFNGKS